MTFSAPAPVDFLSSPDAKPGVTTLAIQQVYFSTASMALRDLTGNAEILVPTATVPRLAIAMLEALLDVTGPAHRSDIMFAARRASEQNDCPDCPLAYDAVSVLRRVEEGFVGQGTEISLPEGDLGISTGRGHFTKLVVTTHPFSDGAQFPGCLSLTAVNDGDGIRLFALLMTPVMAYDLCVRLMRFAASLNGQQQLRALFSPALLGGIESSRPTERSVELPAPQSYGARMDVMGPTCVATFIGEMKTRDTMMVMAVTQLSHNGPLGRKRPAMLLNAELMEQAALLLLQVTAIACDDGDMEAIRSSVLAAMEGQQTEPYRYDFNWDKVVRWQQRVHAAMGLDAPLHAGVSLHCTRCTVAGPFEKGLRKAVDVDSLEKTTSGEHLLGFEARLCFNDVGLTRDPLPSTRVTFGLHGINGGRSPSRIAAIGTTPAAALDLALAMLRESASTRTQAMNTAMKSRLERLLRFRGEEEAPVPPSKPDTSDVDVSDLLPAR